MAGPVPTTLDALILAAQTQLVDWLGWSTVRVRIVDPLKLSFRSQADSFLCLWPDVETLDRPVFAGAGRLDTRLTERLLVNVFTRLGTDEAGDSTSWLTDATLGHIRSARQPVWDALVGRNLIDSSGNQLTIAPLVPVNGGRPRLDLEEKEWGESALAFDVQYILKLTVPPY